MSLLEIITCANKEGRLHVSEKKPNEYFNEIADRAGVDKELLKIQRGKHGQYQISSEDADFVIDIINR